MLFFAMSLFFSALLLFLVQPMVGKMILPALGGTPAVWNTCMVFFQAVLLAGYAYAHGTAALLSVRKQAVLHMVVLLLPLFVLPIVVDVSSVPSESDNPEFWLLGRLLLGVGLPFFVISTHAPLLQRWFSRTGHPAADDPYFLYGASNIGSLLALLGYPLVMERVLEVPKQSWTWSGGYVLLALMVATCGVLVNRASKRVGVAEVPSEPAAADPPERLGFMRQLRWIALAFVPSSLMLGVTTHVTTDLAPVPLLWVIPLALYLLTFVLVFARKPIIPHATMRMVFPFVIVPVAILMIQGEMELGWLPVPAHLLMFFVATMACHGELVADRPHVSHLTRFYFWMSLGGVLGGLLNAVVAPLLFDTVLEYPLMMVAACLIMHRRSKEAGLKVLATDVVAAVVLAAATYGLLMSYQKQDINADLPLLVTVTVPAAFCLFWLRRPLRLGLVLGAVLVASFLGRPSWTKQELYVGRNFFGTKLVTEHSSGYFNVFYHGRTIHGIQDLREPNRRTSLAYFHATGPMGDVFRAFGISRCERRVAIVGLGAGSLATYAQPGQEFDFYEIDPEVARIAENPELFSFLSDCRGQVSVILGDGRLALEEKPDANYGLIVLDAFSSDAVPTHLLTREAIQLYSAKLDEGGLLVFNITNKYLDLAPLLAGLAADAGFECLSRYDHVSRMEYSHGKMDSRFLVMARTARDLRLFRSMPDWNEPKPSPDVPVWTDRYSNILSVVNYR